MPSIPRQPDRIVSVIPVIHTDSLEQARRNASIARELGADGVFLINHDMPADELLEIATALREQDDSFWLGLNCLDLDPATAFRLAGSIASAIWTDSAEIDERRPNQYEAERNLASQTANAPFCLHFGGVAFKYQRSVEDLEAACRLAARYVDVVTTSGDGTGLAPDIGKIARMRASLPDTPLAIASGITPENAAAFAPHADAFLVATGISRSFTELDPKRLSRLLDAVRGPATSKPHGER